MVRPSNLALVSGLGTLQPPNLAGCFRTRLFYYTEGLFMDNYKVLRASRISSLFARALFYSVNGTEEIISEKSQRIFVVGMVLEPVIIRWLRSDGWNVRRNLFLNSNEEVSLSISVNDGSIEAHPDCVISREDTGLILAGIKTMNDRSFRYLKREETVKSHPQYADQLTIYAHALSERGHQINQLAIIALNKNNCEGRIDFFLFEQERYETLKERAERIFACDDAPEQDNRFQSWCCSYCAYAHLCKPARKDTAVGDENVPATDNKEVIDAVELLSESRELERTGKELADEAKAVLDREVRKQGIKSVRAGNLILVLNEIKSSRLDTTALKKAHPDLVQEFMKLSSSVRYDLKEVA